MAVPEFDPQTFTYAQAFSVGRQSPPSSESFTDDFLIEPRPQSKPLVMIGGTLQEHRLMVKAGGRLVDPEG